MDVRPIVSHAPFLPLGHKHASAEETGERALERDADGREGVTLARHLRARARCSLLEEHIVHKNILYIKYLKSAERHQMLTVF